MADPPRDRCCDALLLALSCAAGVVDAVSYLRLGQVFTANMTGHAVLLGIAFVNADSTRIVHALLAICGFFGGAVWGSFIVDSQARTERWPKAVTQALWMESWILTLAAIAWGTPGTRFSGLVTPYIVASAVAMGLQSAAVRDLKVAGVATTYITGTLTSLAADVVGLFRRRSRAEPPAPGGVAPLLLAGVWIVYIVGATVGAIAVKSAPSSAFAIPAALTLAVALVATRRFGRAA